MHLRNSRRRSRPGPIGLALVALLSLGAFAVATTLRGGPSDPPDPASPDGRSGQAGLSPGALEVLGRSAVAWMPGGFPQGAGERIRGLPGVARAAPVLSGVAWLSGGTDASGGALPHPPDGMAYPMEVAGADPTAYARFLPAGRRSLTQALAQGEGILSTTGARIRGVRPGGELNFAGVVVPVAGIVPDELIGGHELLVSRRTGMALGLSLDRYALVEPEEGADLAAIRDAVADLLEPGTPVEVRAWSPAVPYLRHGDGMSSMAELKVAFGEFAADPTGGELEPDPAWVQDNIVTQEVPLLGSITCHRELIAQLVSALEAVVAAAGDAAVGSGYEGCYVPRFINRDPTRALSYHSWGVAIDINAEANPFGAPPEQDPRLVEAMEANGFSWGGRWEVPDGMHFEWTAFPEA